MPHTHHPSSPPRALSSSPSASTPTLSSAAASSSSSSHSAPNTPQRRLHSLSSSAVAGGAGTGLQPLLQLVPAAGERQGPFQPAPLQLAGGGAGGGRHDVAASPFTPLPTVLDSMSTRTKVLLRSLSGVGSTGATASGSLSLRIDSTVVSSLPPDNHKSKRLDIALSFPASAATPPASSSSVVVRSALSTGGERHRSSASGGAADVPVPAAAAAQPVPRDEGHSGASANTSSPPLQQQTQSVHIGNADVLSFVSSASAPADGSLSAELLLRATIHTSMAWVHLMRGDDATSLGAAREALAILAGSASTASAAIADAADLYASEALIRIGRAGEALITHLPSQSDEGAVGGGSEGGGSKALDNLSFAQTSRRGAPQALQPFNPSLLGSSEMGVALSLARAIARIAVSEDAQAGALAGISEAALLRQRLHTQRAQRDALLSAAAEEEDDGAPGGGEECESSPAGEAIARLHVYATMLALRHTGAP